MAFKLENLDVYGQSIKFSYKNSNVFSSHCGLIASLLIIIWLFIYSCLIFFDRLKLEKPNVISTVEAFLISPKLYMIPDLTGYFDANSSYFNFTSQELNDTAFMQISFGLQDIKTLKVFALDPSYFYINLTYTSLISATNTKTVSLFFDYCQRFPYSSQKQFQIYQLNETYCLYSPFILQGDINSSYFKGLTLTLNRCTNNTLEYQTKEELSEYQRLKYVYEQMKDSTYLDSKIFFQSNASSNDENVFNDESYPDYQNSSEININCNLNDLNATLLAGMNVQPNPYINFIDNNLSTETPVVCKSDGEITNRIINTRIIFYYLQNSFNSTNYADTLTTNIFQSALYPNQNINKKISVGFQNDKIITYNSLLPPSMLNQSIINYYMHLSDSSQYLYEDPSSGSFFTFNVQSAHIRNTFQREYLNILDILGVIGGFSSLLMVIGFVFVTYVSSIKMKEKFINETYNVIDPKKMKKIMRTFSDYIKEISSKKEQYEKNKFKGKTFLEEYFCLKLEEIQALQEEKSARIIKYEILYDVFKQGAYSGFYYNYFEIFLNVFCFCCLRRRLRHKNMIFKKACKELESDNDYRSIFRAVQEFEILKKCFLDEGQYNLLNAVANPPITWRNARKDKEKNVEIRASREIKKSWNLIRASRENYDKIIGLEMALDEIFSKVESNETDSALLNSLIINEDLAKLVNKIRETKLKSFKPGVGILNNNSIEELKSIILDENDLNQMINIFH